MRTVSLVPSATETVFALGLGDSLVGVTHECDYPAATANIPKVTRNLLPEDLSSAAIDAAVQERIQRGENIYELDRDMLLDLSPDLILTQALCEVCAVAYDDVKAIAEEMNHDVRVASLDPHTVGEILGTVKTVAQLMNAEENGESLLADLTKRIDTVTTATQQVIERPGVVALEWLDPPYVAGHWMPQLIEYAGGVDLAALPGEHSEQTQWDRLSPLPIDSAFVMPCGYRLKESVAEAEKFSDQLARLEAANYYAVNASDYFSRPGPRVVDGLELIAHTLHPELVAENHADQITKLTV